MLVMLRPSSLPIRQMAPGGSARIIVASFISQPSVESLPYMDQLVDETQGVRFFSKLDLASGYHQ